MARDHRGDGGRSTVSQAGRRRSSVALSDEPLPYATRAVLACLRDHGGERSAVRLARDVASRTTRTPAAAEIRRAYRDLHADHLQRLVDAGLVEYSEEDGTVRLARRVE